MRIGTLTDTTRKEEYSSERTDAFDRLERAWSEKIRTLLQFSQGVPFQSPVTE